MSSTRPTTALKLVPPWRDDLDPPVDHGSPSLTIINFVVRMGVIGVLILCIVGSFSYAAGWLSPGLLTQTKIVHGLEQVNGVHPGFRRNHAKGRCITGYFDSNGNGVPWTKAELFKPGRVPVIGRFSIPGGNPYMADGPAVARGIGLAFRPIGGEEWRMAMLNLPVFVVNSAQGFYDQVLAMKPDPATGKPDPGNVKAFFAAHPESARAVTIIKSQTFSSGFDNSTFNSLDAFWFMNAVGTSTPVRWSMVPVDEYQPENPAESATPDKNYLFDDFITRIQSGPVQWRMILTVGQPGDPTDDATIPWPDNRQHIDAGMLTIDRAESEGPGTCRDINFDPLVLPFGITPSDDPLLSARSAVYSQSFRRREGEKKSPSAVRVPDARDGG